MKRLFCILIVFGAFILPLSAAHIRGGELYYKYLGNGSAANSSKYLVTLKLYIDCGQNSEGQLEEQVPITIFSLPGNTQYSYVRTANMVKEQFIRYDPNSNPCITNPPLDVCYRLRYFETTIELPDSDDGYILSFQRCCRIENIKNMVTPSDDYGATYLCQIPGKNSLPEAPKNSSPLYNTNDAVAICVGSGFVFDFSAVDLEGDSLSYRLCNAYAGGGPGNGRDCLNCPTPNPAGKPPYQSIPYSASYSGTLPMGVNISIDSKTGIITGIAPNTLGQFVVTACVDEYRNGVLINTHRKDIHIKVSDCNPLKAKLDPDYSYCESLEVSFRNKQVNPTGSVYTWDFGDGSAPQTSTNPVGMIQHQYADSGTYTVKLKVVLAGQCVDSTFTKARVYPGFYPGFTSNGSCLYSPFSFTDTTKSRYGVAAKWKWDFGDETTNADTSDLQNPKWTYSSLGLKNVRLIVASDKGCRDTVPLTVEVKEKPDLFVPFTDTLICDIDTLQLQANGTGVFSWFPQANMLGENSSSPIVFPKSTTTYTVSLTDQACVATQNIRVRVVSEVTLDAGADTTICATDSIRFSPSGDGLQFTWTASPAAPIKNATDKNAISIPSGTTRYHVIARIGKCFKEDDLEVHTVPYPIVNAGNDTTICYKDTAFLHGSTNGSSFRWEPLSSLGNANTLEPYSFSTKTAVYALYGYDTLGCPKPGIDQVRVTVRPEIFANAGNDTAIVKGQPLQLQGSGSDFFEWTPAIGLNFASIANPVALINESKQFAMRTFTVEGCFDMDTINIQVFQTMPDIFVPNAFVPGGRNNELRPKPVGLSSIDFFRVFNRWGQLVFQTKQIGQGWDGTVNGVLQASGAYVWMISGTDFTGKKVFKKGTATLIR